MSWTRVLVLWLVVGLTVGRLGPAVWAEEITDDLATVARTGPGGRGSVAARKATDRLARNGLELLPRLLEAMDTDNIVAANWYRTVYEQITRRELARDPVPDFPVSLLKTYVTNPKRQGRVRRLVLDLVERLEPGTTDSLIPGLMADPEFRDDAVAAALARGDRARKAGRTREASGEYRKAFQAARNSGQIGTAADRLKAVGQEVSVVTHMGFVTIGTFTLTVQGVEGAIYMMLAHGIVSAALFLIVGVVYDRIHSRDISAYGGLVHRMPTYSLIFMLFMLASVGLPGTAGFVGEFLILVGAFKANTWVAALAATGLVLGAAYMLYLYRRVIFGKLTKDSLTAILDMNAREIAVFAPLVVLVIFMGVYPGPFLEIMHVSVTNLLTHVDTALNAGQAITVAGR